MQQKVTQFFHNFADALTIYDYLALTLLLLLFLLCIVLAIFARNRAGLAVFFALIAFTLLVAGPFGVKIALDSIIRSNSIEITNVQKLNFSDALVIDGTLTNKGKVNFSKCDIKVSVVKEYANQYLQMLFNLKPIMTKKHTVEGIEIAQSVQFNIVIDQFTLNDGFITNAKGECYP